MTVARSYGTPRNTTDALGEIARHAGTQFCPDAAAVLERLGRQGVLATS
jgi:HD-GYP domain-containing protein (c-di-GMP phosphodiesterase class II)